MDFFSTLAQVAKNFPSHFRHIPDRLYAGDPDGAHLCSPWKEKQKNIIFDDMKYIVRVIKYFIYVCVLMTLILWILSLLHIVEGNVETMFRDGYKSIGYIALMFLAVSSLYPRFGFTKRGTVIPGAYSEIRGGVINYMESKGYRLESEEDENLTFRLRSPLARLTRMLEDRITMSRELPGYTIEGPTKDVVRISYGLENAFKDRADQI